MDGKSRLISWLRGACAEYVLEPAAVYRRRGTHAWPLVADDEAELEQKLNEGGHFLPLPKEPAALANVLEVSLAEYLLSRLASLDGALGRRGTERGYPDIEISGAVFGDVPHALDIKVARRARNGRKTQSRITLYTGNTYFRFPELRWPGTFRPFNEYASHLDLIALYTLNEDSVTRIEDLELVVQESWRIASTQRSSTTREYIGAVMSIADLRHGRGEFETLEAFYKYWRRFDFKVGKAVQKQLERLLKRPDVS
jgi:hypothetical protein